MVYRWRDGEGFLLWVEGFSVSSSLSRLLSGFNFGGRKNDSADCKRGDYRAGDDAGDLAVYGAAGRIWLVNVKTINLRRA